MFWNTDAHIMFIMDLKMLIIQRSEYESVATWKQLFFCLHYTNVWLYEPGISKELIVLRFLGRSLLITEADFPELLFLGCREDR